MWSELVKILSMQEPRLPSLADLAQLGLVIWLIRGFSPQRSANDYNSLDALETLSLKSMLKSPIKKISALSFKSACLMAS